MTEPGLVILILYLLRLNNKNIHFTKTKKTVPNDLETVFFVYKKAIQELLSNYFSQIFIA